MQVKTILVSIGFFLILAGPTWGQQPLEVQWTTYLGGSGKDEARDVVVDENDNVYVCGVFESPDFPRPRNVPTSYDTTGPGGYLASFSPQGELLWLQYFSCVRPHALAITKNNILVMAGSTPVECGGVNGIIGLFTLAGERAGRSYAFQGSKGSIITCVDAGYRTSATEEYIYVAGITESLDLDVVNAPQPVYGGDGTSGEGAGDGFVARLRITPIAGVLEARPEVITYYGGRYLDEILALRVDLFRKIIYIGGRTRSDNLPGPGVIQPNRLGMPTDNDGFVACLDASSLICQWKTYLGGTGDETVHGLQPGGFTIPGGDFVPGVRVCGVYSNGVFPYPGKPGNSFYAFNGGTVFGGDAFYLEISSGIAAPDILLCTSVGSPGDDVAYSFPRKEDAEDRCILFSNGLVTSSGIRKSAAFMFASKPNLTYVRVYDGNGEENLLSQDQARFGFGGFEAGPSSRYFCGNTTSTDLPGRNAAGPIFQRSLAGDQDGYIVKLGCGSQSSRIVASSLTLCSTSDTISLSLTPMQDSVRWNDGSRASSRFITSPGTYSLQYTSAAGCLFVDTVVIRQGLVPTGTLTPSDTVVFCDTAEVLVTVNGNNLANIKWSGGTPVDAKTVRVTTPGRYWASLVTPEGCTANTDTLIVESKRAGIGTTVVADVLSAGDIDIGDTLHVALRLKLAPGDVLATFPVDWSMRLRFDRTVLFPVAPLPLGIIDDSSRRIDLFGKRATGSDTLAIVSFRVALGDTDSVTIDIDSVSFEPCSVVLPSLRTDVRIAGICQAGGAKRLIAGVQPRLVALVAPNPVPSAGASAGAIGDAMNNAEARVVDLLGQTVMLERVQSSDSSVRWSIPASLPAGAYILVVQNAERVSTVRFEVVR